MKKLSSKLILSFIFLGLIAILPSSWIGYSGASALLEREAFEKLTAVRENKKREIERYSQVMRGQVITLSEDLMVIKALRELSAAFHQLPAPESGREIITSLESFYNDVINTKLITQADLPYELSALMPRSKSALFWQYHFLSNNPYSQSEKYLLDSLETPFLYSQLHSEYHPKLRNFLKAFNYYDLFLIDMKGNIVYSVYKEIDFATNLKTGPHRESNLAKTYKSLENASAPGDVNAIDFDAYLPSYNAPAGFIGSPVFDQSQQIGVLIFQIPVSVINEIMTGKLRWKQDGLGNSGETYLLGNDLTMRNDSRFLLQDEQKFLQQLSGQKNSTTNIDNIARHKTTVLYQKVNTSGSRSAISGQTDTRIIDDYRGISVLSSFAPLEFLGMDWAIISEIDHEEIFAPIKNLREKLIYLTLAFGSMIILSGFMLSRRITRPLELLSMSTLELGSGDFKKRVDIHSQDEIGTLAGAFNQMAENLEKTTVSKSYVDKILTSMNEALFVLQFDPEEKQLLIETINPAAAHILGYDHNDIVGHTIDLFFDGTALSEEDWYLLIRQSSLPSMDRNLVTRSGKKIPVIFSVSVMQDDAGKKSEVICVCVIQDITERKRYEQKLQLAGAVYQAASEGIMVVSIDQKITDVNPAFEQMTGYTRKEVLGKNPRLLESSQNMHTFYDVMLKKIEKDRYWRGEFSAQRKHGTLLPLITSITALVDENAKTYCFVCIMSDVSELKEREQRSWSMANFDPLTDLPNRNLFADRLEQSMRNAQRNNEIMALLFVDLDGFKVVNDSHGHSVGDSLLKHAAKRLKRDLREIDSVARIGGDEFTVILVNLDQHQDAEKVATKLLEVMREPFKIDGITINLSTSIGIAFYPEQANNSKELLRKADYAMYEAKASGKNTYRIFENKPEFL